MASWGFVLAILLPLIWNARCQDMGDMIPQMGECCVCLLICNRFNSETEFLPKDSGTLLDGIDVFPNKPNQLTGQSFPSSELYGENCHYTDADADALVNSISRAVQFYEQNYEKLNLRTDGGVGLSILANQLETINPKIQSNVELTERFQALLTSSKSIAPKIFEMSTVAAERLPPMSKAMRIMESQINLREEQVRASDKVWKSPEIIPALEKLFMERIGNEIEIEIVYPLLDIQCMASVVYNCDLPRVCSKMYFSEDIYSQYMLTHQILILQFAEQRNPSAFQGWNEYRDKLCTKAYLEADFIENHDYPARWRDLFAEQVAFCGLAGYPNFFRRDWLNQVLSWQSTSTPGCFPDIYSGGADGVRSTDVAVETPVVPKNGGNSTEPCLIHLTSVSLAALTLNLRYMVNNCQVEIFENIQY